MRTLWDTLLDTGIVIVCLLVLLSILQTRDAEDVVQVHREQAQHAERLLAQCMNGKALYDKQSKTAYFCGRAVPVDGL